MSGTRSIIFQASESNPDCSPVEAPTIRITRLPKHGTASVVVEEGYTSYAKESQYAPCNLTKRDVTRIYYTSTERYTGKDDLSIEVFYARGGYSAGVITINVR